MEDAAWLRGRCTRAPMHVDGEKLLLVVELLPRHATRAAVM
jgi:hypothetical protein